MRRNGVRPLQRVGSAVGGGSVVRVVPAEIEIGAYGDFLTKLHRRVDIQRVPEKV
ncbi:hypothetical protein D3C86_2107070 [compost metagenome]